MRDSDTNYVMEQLYDSESLCDIYGEYFDIHHFRCSGSVIYCLISAYKATVDDINNVLIEYLGLDPMYLKIQEININSLFNF